jgi:hypothetical protein
VVIDPTRDPRIGKHLREIANDAREIFFLLLAAIPATCIVALIIYGFQDIPGGSNVNQWNSGLALQWFVLLTGLAVPTTIVLLRARKPGHSVAALCGIALAVAVCALSFLVFLAMSGGR